MSYKISGSTSENSRIIIMNETDWSVEYTTSGTLGNFEISGLSNGKKVVLARNDLGKITAAGDIIPIQADIFEVYDGARRYVNETYDTPQGYKDNGATESGLYWVLMSGEVTPAKVFVDMSEAVPWSLVKCFYNATTSSWNGAAGFINTQTDALDNNDYALSDALLNKFGRTAYKIEGSINNWSNQTPTVYAKRNATIDYSSTGAGECAEHKTFYSDPECTNQISTNTYGYWSSYHGLSDVTHRFDNSYYTTQESYDNAWGIFGKLATGTGSTVWFNVAGTCLRIWIR